MPLKAQLSASGVVYGMADKVGLMEKMGLLPCDFTGKTETTSGKDLGWILEWPIQEVIFGIFAF